MAIVRRDPAERFLERIERRGTDECWLLTGRLTHYGYASFCVDGVERYGHRFAYEMFIRTIPDGLQIDHLCRNRACVNPEHLDAVTPTENKLRGDSPPARNARKTHCIAGHPYNKANTWISKEGYRQCRICNARRQRELQHRRRIAA